MSPFPVNRRSSDLRTREQCPRQNGRKKLKGRKNQELCIFAFLEFFADTTSPDDFV